MKKKILVRDHTKTHLEYYFKGKGVFIPSKERQSRPKNV